MTNGVSAMETYTKSLCCQEAKKLKKHIFKEEAVYIIIYLIALHKYIRKFEGQPILFFRDTPK